MVLPEIEPKPLPNIEHALVPDEFRGRLRYELGKVDDEFIDANSPLFRSEFRKSLCSVGVLLARASLQEGLYADNKDAKWPDVKATLDYFDQYVQFKATGTYSSFR